MCVLLVEDEPLILMSAAGCLEDAGHKVMTAEHGLEAVTLIGQWPIRFSMLITDYHMPHGFNGRQLVHYMRQSYPDIPMLITTDLADVVTAEFRERHRVEMLVKPYDPNSLLATVGRLVSNSVSRTPSRTHPV